MEQPLPAAGHDPSAPAYERRRPEESVLYRAIQEELETFLAAARERDRPLPRFVEREMRGFLECGRRRMADTAAHLVDRVFPEAPVRQWVLTLPFALRYRLAYDSGLTSAVLREFVRAVFAS